jgi:hypothetical protein
MPLLHPLTSHQPILWPVHLLTHQPDMWFLRRNTEFCVVLVWVLEKRKKFV